MSVSSSKISMMCNMEGVVWVLSSGRRRFEVRVGREARELIFAREHSTCPGADDDH
jgi:hypothetical protein